MSIYWILFLVAFAVALVIKFHAVLTLPTALLCLILFAYGADPEYQQYKKSTPILVPLLPIYSVKKHSWLRG